MLRCITVISLALVSVSVSAQVCKTPQQSKTPECRAKLEKEMASLLEDSAKPKEPTTAAEIKESIDRQVSSAKEQLEKFGPLAPVSSEQLSKNWALCKNTIANKLKDPTSAQYRNLKRSDKGSVQYNTDSASVNNFAFPGVTYSIEVNAKNGFGGYAGFKIAHCVFDLHENKIVYFTMFN